MTAARERDGDRADARPIIGGGGPFVLCDDGRAGAPTRLFVDPVEIVRANVGDEVAPALARVADAAGRGLHAAGFLSYEAGYALEPRLAPLVERAPAGQPLLWFGLFERAEPIARDAVAARLPDPAGATAQAPVPQAERADYEAGVAEVLALIAAGEVYQANLSFRSLVRFAGHPLALYAGLRARAEAGWGGVAYTGEHWLLSASPELFFALEAGRLTARPMKGTARRGADPTADQAAVAALAADPKARAENLMIVDLTRNDLSRVSVAGTVQVPALFAVETYPTVHQMTSTVEATLTPGLGPVDVLAAAFPCGSITGAPKIRAMEAIASLEAEPRGAYTGSLGWIAPGVDGRVGDAAFNVMIRTLSVRDGEPSAVLGLGAGIVADSAAAAEWAECIDKGAFVAAGQRPFDLIETMRFDPRAGVADLERHVARVAASAAALGFAFNAHDARNVLQGATFRLRDARRVRLRLSRDGATSVAIGDLPPEPTGPVPVALRSLPVASNDFRLHHKTSDRSFWERGRVSDGLFETLFVDADGFLTEGSFTSLFVDDGDVLLTPPLSRGLLPGVLRERLIDEGRAREADLRVEDLADGFWIGNAVRGLIRARLG